MIGQTTVPSPMVGNVVVFDPSSSSVHHTSATGHPQHQPSSTSGTHQLAALATSGDAGGSNAQFFFNPTPGATSNHITTVATGHHHNQHQSTAAMLLGPSPLAASPVAMPLQPPPQQHPMHHHQVPSAPVMFAVYAPQPLSSDVVPFGSLPPFDLGSYSTTNAGPSSVQSLPSAHGGSGYLTVPLSSMMLTTSNGGGSLIKPPTASTTVAPTTTTLLPSSVSNSATPLTQGFPPMARAHSFSSSTHNTTMSSAMHFASHGGGSVNASGLMPAFSLPPSSQASPVTLAFEPASGPSSPRQAPSLTHWHLNGAASVIPSPAAPPLTLPTAPSPINHSQQQQPQQLPVSLVVSTAQQMSAVKTFELLCAERLDRNVAAKIWSLSPQEAAGLHALLEANAAAVLYLCEQERGRIVESLLERIGADHCSGMLRVVAEYYVRLATSQRGCIAIQRIYAPLAQTAHGDRLFALCLDHLNVIARDHFGNYLCKYFLTSGRPEFVSRMAQRLADPAAIPHTIFVDKFGSYVVDEVFKQARPTDAMSGLLQRMFFGVPDDSYNAGAHATTAAAPLLHAMCADQYGNYVVQSALSYLHRAVSATDYDAFVACACVASARSPYEANILKFVPSPSASLASSTTAAIGVQSPSPSPASAALTAGGTTTATGMAMVVPTHTQHRQAPTAAMGWGGAAGGQPPVSVQVTLPFLVGR